MSTNPGSANSSDRGIERLAERLRSRRGLDKAESQIRLSYRRIYILPTREGLWMAAMLVAMLLGSMNYKLSLGYILVFLLSGMGMAAMLHSFRNLNGLIVSAGRVDPVFAGETLRFRICLRSPDALERVGIALEDTQPPDSTPTTEPAGFRAPPQVVNLSAQGSDCLDYHLPTRQRGVTRPGRIKLYTRYPLGLFYAWTWVNLDARALVYPRPFPRELPFPPALSDSGNGTGVPGGIGSDDFAGIRDYRAGDSLRHLHWKSLARGGDLMTREFSAETRAVQWLDWRQTPASQFEEQLSILCRWSLDAHRLGQSHGLRLPDQTLPPPAQAADNDAHLKACLRALALSSPSPSPSPNSIQGNTPRDPSSI